jgi:hypothetical protein
MKKLAAILLLAVGLASPAIAGQVQVGYPAIGGAAGSNYGPYQTGQGGEFTLTPLTAWINNSAYGLNTKNVGVTGSFQTFCIEGNEYIYPYPAVYEAGLSTYAIQGGQSGQEPPDSGQDPVSVGTRWLYSQFATTRWDSSRGLSYDYGSNRSTSADALQRAFWWLEGEEGVVYNDSNIYMAAVVARFGSDVNAMASEGEQFGVYALNIWTINGGVRTDAQTQLFYVPDGGMTLMLLGGALVGLGALRRKFRL